MPPPGQFRPPGPAQYPPSLRPRPRPQGPQNQGPVNKPPRDSLFPTRDKPSVDKGFHFICFAYKNCIYGLIFFFKKRITKHILMYGHFSFGLFFFFD